jgi:hypothetical protein
LAHAKGEWVGVELPFPDGLNDGSIAGTRYFHCENNTGLSTNLNYGALLSRLLLLLSRLLLPPPPLPPPPLLLLLLLLLLPCCCSAAVFDPH